MVVPPRRTRPDHRGEATQQPRAPDEDLCMNGQRRFERGCRKAASFDLVMKRNAPATRVSRGKTPRLRSPVTNPLIDAIIIFGRTT